MEVTKQDEAGEESKLKTLYYTSVSDPHYLYADPGPTLAKIVMRIRIQV